MPLIELRSIVKQFGRQLVLDHLDLTVDEGESLVIVGASGSGKSVILKHIVGLLEPDEGEVWFDGHRTDTLSERAWVSVRTQFGFLFQMGALFDSMSVEQNIGFPLVEHSALTSVQINSRVDRCLALVGLPEVRKKMPAELSGGQRKRVALARAIALEPRVILYDEPTTGLDPIRSDVINELIVELQRKLKVTSVVVTHDMQSAFKVATRIVMLSEGKLIFNGTATQIQQTTDPVVRRFVLGEADEKELASIKGL